VGGPALLASVLPGSVLLGSVLLGSMLLGRMLAGAAPRWSCSWDQRDGEGVAFTSGTAAICGLLPAPEYSTRRRPRFRRSAEPPVHPRGRSAAAAPGHTIGS
jgi:hypothetical protein